MRTGEYIFLACGCASLGIFITIAVLGVCRLIGFEIDRHWWVVTIPAFLSLFLNVTFIEIYRKLKNKNK